MRKKVVTKIGDIFCIEFDGKFKCFFQSLLSTKIANSSLK